MWGPKAKERRRRALNAGPKDGGWREAYQGNPLTPGTENPFVISPLWLTGHSSICTKNIAVMMVTPSLQQAAR